SYIRTIEFEYEKVSKHWLNIHTAISVGLAIASFLLELIVFFVLDRLDMVGSTLPIYMFRYLFIPTGLNLLILLVILLVRKLYPKRLTLQSYVVSLGLVAMCFVLFTIHSIFPSLYFLFAIPLMFSCLYENYLLTTVTAICVLVSRIVGDVVIVWDSEKVLLLDNEYNAVNFSLSILILVGFYIACMTLIYFEQERNHAAIKKEIERVQYRQGMIIDQLTSLYNRTALDEVLAHLSENDAGLVCAMLDIDHFKEVNDTLGHLAGDNYLKTFGEILRKECEQHLVFRYGGDEFCVLFNGISMDEAGIICKRICRESSKILEPGRIPHTAAASFGLAVYQSGQSSDELIQTADKALYEQKYAHKSKKETLR
ncbi:MAG: GGDEF domain-containing protein, partial [Lachnospiraceae bacterium]|nr:GGDEF domain-containing protein [Lachnospiraceae bacterium]